MTTPMTTMPETRPVAPIRPGYMIALKTSTEVKHPDAIVYHRELLEETILPDGSSKKRWKTTKIQENPGEFKVATTVRLRVRTVVTSHCAETPFGLICPKDDMPALRAALAALRPEVQAFNETSKHYRVVWSMLPGEIAENATEAVEAISEQVALLVEQLERATIAGSVDGIRGVCGNAVQLGKLLEQESEGKAALDRAIKAARRVARQVVKRVEKSTEDLEAVLQEQHFSPILAARAFFVKPAGAGPADDDEGDDMPAVDVQRAAGVALPSAAAA